MKFKSLNLLFVIALMAFVFSCGDDDENQFDGTYYIEFKMDGELKELKTTEQFFHFCGDCLCGGVTVITPTNIEGAGINICYEGDEVFTRAEIEDMEGATLEFIEENSQNVFFAFSLQSTSYDSRYAISQTGTFIITEVVPDGFFGSLAQYKAKGRFECTVRADNGENDIAITEGKFVVRFTETNQIPKIP